MSPERRNPMEEAIRNPLPRLEKRLTEEFEALPDDRIHEVARHALDELADARVREFVPIFAWRHARDHLRKAAWRPPPANAVSLWRS
jgi:hypothetical protein